MSVTTDLDAIRARWKEAFRLSVAGRDDPEWDEAIIRSSSDIPFLLDLVDELRRRADMWKENYEMQRRPKMLKGKAP